jgi:CDP-glycerol glycerophosphotransferase (TagB/SpsB family)
VLRGHSEPACYARRPLSRLEYLLASALLRIVGRVASLLPIVPDRIVLASPRTPRLDGNLRFIRAAFASLRPDLRPVVLVEPYGFGLRAKLAYLARAVRGMYFLRTARLVVIDNAWLPVHVAPHRRGTTVVQVWHAASAIKRFGLDTLTPLDEPERTFLHRYYDEVVVSSTWARGPYAAALRTPIDHVVALGTPRTDFFFDEAAMAASRERILAAHPMLRGRRVVLYAPTIRGRGEAKHSSPAIDGVTLRNLLPPDHALVLKGHPNVDPGRVASAGYDVVADRSDELNDLLALADVLVTDYSSAVFEFAMLRRPIVYVLNDLAAYARNPGVYVDFDADMVGARAVDTESVARAILDSPVDAAAYDAFIARHVGACDGHASERFVERYGALLRPGGRARVSSGR